MKQYPINHLMRVNERVLEMFPFDCQTGKKLWKSIAIMLYIKTLRTFIATFETTSAGTLLLQTIISSADFPIMPHYSKSASIFPVPTETIIYP